MRTLFAAILLIAIAISSLADDKASAEYRYMAPREMSRAQAEETAVQKARLQALADKYGVFHQQIDAMDLRDDAVNFVSQITADVRGVWVKDTKQPEVRAYIDGEFTVVEAKVWGIVRELKNEGPEFSACLLRNGKDDQCRAMDFIDGDEVYLSFRSAVDGYLAVFSRDDSVRCLLPRLSAADGLQPVKANERYVFFDRRGERIVAATDAEVEANTLYVLFSTEKVLRPLARRVDEGDLAVYSIDEFFNILGKKQQSDPSLQVRTLNFLIRKD